MRQWMVDPKCMCQKHLCGCHVEHHMFVGSMKKKIKMDGYLKNNLLEPRSLFERHKVLSEEMTRRGMNHKSPLEENECECICYLDEYQQNWEIDKESALKDLLSRCPECKKRYKENCK
jgi:hypothetical protein